MSHNTYSKQRGSESTRPLKQESVIKESNPKSKSNNSNTATLKELYSLATPFDIILMILGVIGSLGTGEHSTPR